MAMRIILTRHGRWDGTGYPLHIRGEYIPIEGRIIAGADDIRAIRGDLAAA